MSDPKFQPSTVTKPIQLLAAWLIGLIAIDGSFLAAASVISRPDWAPAFLVIAAIWNVPLFLVCLFLLQTRFRPEMQEDSYYSKYLEKRSEQTDEVVRVKIGGATRHIERDRTVTTTELIPLQGPFAVEAIETYSATKIHLNNLLPQYNQIKLEIISMGLNISAEFGTTSVKPTVPVNQVVAFGPNCAIPVLQSIIRICARNGIKGIAALGGTRTSAEMDNERIYIGAYSYDPDDGRVGKFELLKNPLLSALLDPDITESKLVQLLPRIG